MAPNLCVRRGRMGEVRRSSTGHELITPNACRHSRCIRVASPGCKSHRHPAEFSGPAVGKRRQICADHGFVARERERTDLRDEHAQSATISIGLRR